MPLDDQDKIWLTQAIGGQITELRTELRADLERVETSLLTEFHKWASPTDLKLRSHREALRALDLEIEAIGGRVTKLEAAMDQRQ